MIQEGCPDFILKGTYGEDICFSAHFKDDVLKVSKSEGIEKDEAEYRLENGLFDDDDSDEFSWFFNPTF